MRWTIALGFLAAHALLVGLGVWRTPLSNGLDELAHVSYVEEIRQHGLGDFNPAAMRMLPANLAGTFTSAPNYLNHPPLYYLAMSWLVPGDQPMDVQALRVLRGANALLSILTVGCLLTLGVLRRLEPRLLMLYGVLIVVNPFVWAIGGIVSNDNAALLGGAMCLLGAQAVMLQARVGWAVLAFGVVIAAAAKLNAALLVVLLAAAFLATMRRRGAWPQLIVAAAIGIAALPYLWMTFAFGSPAPTTPGFAQNYRDITQLSGWGDQPAIGFARYAMLFAANLLHHWSYQALASGPRGAVMLAVPIVGVSLAAYAFVPTRAKPDPLLSAALFALILVGVIHLIYSYRNYLALGSPPFDAVPRYYLPLALGAVPLAICRTLSEMPPRWRIVTTWLLLLAAIAQAPMAWAALD